MVAVIEPAAPSPVPVPTTAASNASIDAYLDYAQWFIEEVKPRVG